MIPALPPHLHAASAPGAYPYLLSTPAPGDANEHPLPLILFLHGAGQRGTELTDVLKHGLTRLLAGAPELTPAELELGRTIARQFIVVAPQCDAYEVWDDGRLLKLLDEVTAMPGVDVARVYLTGLSMGGFGVWSLGLRHPGRFAALVPVCGGGRIRDVTTARREQPDAFLKLGIWAFHGACDPVVPLEESERMIQAVREAGLEDARFTIYPEAGHDAWTPAYADPELYRWMLRHGRS